MATYQISAMVRYAIVPTRGCYGQGSTVLAVGVSASRARAVSLAERYTREHQREMERHGGTSGGYRVVATDATTKRAAMWLGVDLDREPSA